MECMIEITPVVVCIIVSLGILDSILSIFSCTFFTVELPDNQRSDTDEETVLSIGLFRYRLGDTPVGFGDSTSCQTYDSDAPSTAAQAFAIMAPLFALAGCVLGCLGVSFWRKNTPNRLAGACCAVALISQLLTFLSVLEEEECNDDTPGECSLNIGGELSIVASILYLIGAIGFFGLPKPTPLGWSIKEALTGDTKKADSSEKTEVDDSGNSTGVTHLQDEYAGIFERDDDIIPATREDARNMTLQDEHDSDDDADIGPRSQNPSTISNHSRSCKSPLGIHDTIPAILPVEQLQLTMEEDPGRDMIADIDEDESPEVSSNSGSEQEDDRDKSGMTAATTGSTDQDDSITSDSAQSPISSSLRKKSFHTNFTGQCITKAMGNDELDYELFGDDGGQDAIMVLFED